MRQIHIITAITIAVLLFSCKDDSKQSTVIVQFKQQTIVFDDGREAPISDKEISQVFYLIRHAEKDTTIKDNPPLTTKGEERSVELADMFRQSRVDVIYSTVFMRTLLTVDTLSKSKGIKILPYDHKNLKVFAESLKQNKTIQTAVIVGHSNSTPTLVSFLADRDSSEFPQLDESIYDKFYIVIIHKDGTTDVKELNYYTS